MMSSSSGSLASDGLNDERRSDVLENDELENGVLDAVTLYIRESEGCKDCAYASMSGPFVFES